MKMKKKSVALIAIAMVSTLLLGGCGQVKVGYVNERRLAEEAPQIKATMEEGTKKLEETQSEIEK